MVSLSFLFVPVYAFSKLPLLLRQSNRRRPSNWILVSVEESWWWMASFLLPPTTSSTSAGPCLPGFSSLSSVLLPVCVAVDVIILFYFFPFLYLYVNIIFYPSLFLGFFKRSASRRQLLPIRMEPLLDAEALDDAAAGSVDN